MEAKKIVTRTTSGALVTIDRKRITGICAKLDDKNYLGIEIDSYYVIPIHPEHAKRVAAELYNKESHVHED